MIVFGKSPHLVEVLWISAYSPMKCMSALTKRSTRARGGFPSHSVLRSNGVVLTSGALCGGGRTEGEVKIVGLDSTLSNSCAHPKPWLAEKIVEPPHRVLLVFSAQSLSLTDQMSLSACSPQNASRRASRAEGRPDRRVRLRLTLRDTVFDDFKAENARKAQMRSARIRRSMMYIDQRNVAHAQITLESAADLSVKRRSWAHHAPIGRRPPCQEYRVVYVCLESPVSSSVSAFRR